MPQGMGARIRISGVMKRWEVFACVVACWGFLLVALAGNLFWL